MKVWRRFPANICRVSVGRMRHRRDATMQAARVTVSTRALERVARATAVSGLQHGPVLLLVVEDAPRAPYHTGERVLVDVDRKPRLLVEHEVKSADECSTAGHHDATIDDVGGKLRRRDFERAPHGVHDLLDWLLDRLADFRRVDANRLRDA